MPPIPIGPVTNGDELRVIARDSYIFGGCRGIDPLYLHCPSTGSVQTLDADGFSEPSCAHPPEPFPGAVFYDETFTVNLWRRTQKGPASASVSPSAVGEPPPSVRHSRGGRIG